MPARGAKPKPVKDHIRAGTFRPDRHKRKPASSDKKAPHSPKGLSPEALTSWQELVYELGRVGTLHSADRHVIECAAVALGRLREARVMINRTGIEVRGDRGAVVAPAFRVELSAARELRALLAELGLTPTSRTRLGLDYENPIDIIERTIGPSPRVAMRERALRQEKAV